MTRTEIVLEVLGLEVASRRGGRAWMLCPYHDDHSPTSFFVRLKGKRAGQNHCFACKNGGGLLDLVMHVRGCNLETAIAFVKLAGKGYAPPKKHVTVVARPARLGRRRFKMPTEVIREPLAEWVTLARRYAESRGITQEEVDEFGLGYAVDGRLAGRIVIPWLGAGRIVAGYSARTFVGDEPKYQTPPMSDGPDLSVMVGEHLWPMSIHDRDVVVVTEGALNGFAVRRVFPDVSIAALGGSEIDALKIVKLATFKRVIALTDPDTAGDVAAAALTNKLGRYTRVDRVRLPRKKDALDVLLERGNDVLRAFIAPALRAA